MNRPPFAPEEWYHCFNRGVDKRITFETSADYGRFLKLLYLLNDKGSLDIRNLSTLSLEEIFNIERHDQLVEIGAFCLMPNHYHLLLYECIEGGITQFMRKIGTAYTMYFNVKNQRTGNLFNRPFRSRHIADDQYLQHAIRYIHFNPAELQEPGWKSGVIRDLPALQKWLMQYPYSSFGAMHGEIHPLRPILGPTIFSIADLTAPDTEVENALAYYAEHATDLQK